jgi:hypothetical protein
VAQALLDAWPDYEAAASLAVLEQAGLAALAAEWQQGPLALAADLASLRQLLQAEHDLARLLAALRLRGARLAGEAVPRWVEEARPPKGAPGGLTPALLDAVARSQTREELAQPVRSALPAGWRAAWQRWVADGDLVALGAGLSERLARDAAALSRTADPLGIGLPVAYTVALETEVRNLRVMGLGQAHGLSPERIQQEVLVL